MYRTVKLALFTVSNAASAGYQVVMNNTNNEWSGPLYIGTPSQYLSVFYDTTWNSAAVTSTNCTTEYNATACPTYMYNSTASSTANVTESITLASGMGEVTDLLTTEVESATG